MEWEDDGSGDADHPDHWTPPTVVINHLLVHDLTNHLQVIRGTAELLRDDPNDQDVLDHLRVIDHQTNAAVALLQETKALLHGTQSASLESRAIGAVIDSQLERLNARYPASTITIERSGDLAVPAQPYLGPIVGNLLGNALEHADEDAPHVHVTVTVDTETVAIEIADDGPGIADAVLDGLASSDAHAPGDRGLSIVQSLIDAYGGGFSIDSDATGTTITVMLPVLTEKEPLDFPRSGAGRHDPVTIQQPVGTNTSPSTAVVRAVAAVTDNQIEDLDPLCWTIDTDALDALVTGESWERLEFEYAGHTVSLSRDEIRIASAGGS